MQSALTLPLLIIFVAGIASEAVPELRKPSYEYQRIVGGSVTTINNYPFGAAMLSNIWGWGFIQMCGGTILTARTVMSAAHCFEDNMVWQSPNNWRIRVGSSFASSGGVVHQVDLIRPHQSYSHSSMDFDLAILRISTTITYTGTTIAQASIASANYQLQDNQVLWAMGWGLIHANGPASEQLRHVQVFSLNQEECRRRHGIWLTDNMLCAGVWGSANHHQCHGDSGSPLVHNGVVVGVCSWGRGCDSDYWPAVNVRVSSYTNWIVNTVNSIV